MGKAELKDHQLAELTNGLRNVAKRYGQTQQLRSKLACVLAKYIKSADREASDAGSRSTHSNS